MSSDPKTRLIVTGLGKAFELHLQGGLGLPVFGGLEFSLSAGECVALAGPSGIGKSTVLRMIYGNYRVDAGQIVVVEGGRLTDVATAAPRRILQLRRDTIGYVSQFLRALPRVPALDIVAEPLRARGVAAEEARARAAEMLSRLSIPERLWSVPPATFSGGEQQRINIARGFVADFPVLLLDEPTASLDAQNVERVCGLIEDRRAAGAAILGIFHNSRLRERLAMREIDLTAFAGRAAA